MRLFYHGREGGGSGEGQVRRDTGPGGAGGSVREVGRAREVPADGPPTFNPDVRATG